MKYTISDFRGSRQGLLSDYKVLIMYESDMPTAAQEMVANEVQTRRRCNKLIGCINALSKELVGDNALVNSDPEPVHTAVAFAKHKNI